MSVTTSTWARYCSHLLRWALAGVFIYSGCTKLLAVKEFAKTISHYDLVPETLLAPVAIGLPVVELLAGLALLVPLPGALTAITGMLVMFVVVLWYGILKNLEIDCGCFSSEELKGQASLRMALYRDFIMLAACSYLYIYRFLSEKRSQSANGRLSIKNIL